MMYDENSNNVMAMANHLMNVKDSRWLQLEVCREFQRGKCNRKDLECKFAHPAPHVEIQNGRCTACYDSIKDRCNRVNPPCKYLHPPQHLKDQLLINGKNTLALKNLIMNQVTGTAVPVAATTANVVPSAAMPTAVFNPLTAAALAGGYAVPPTLQSLTTYPYYTINPTTLYPGFVAGSTSPEALQIGTGVVGGGNQNVPCASPVNANMAAAAAQAKAVARNDRIEVCREFLRGTCQRPTSECKYAHPGPEVERYPDGTVAVCLDFVRAGGNLMRNGSVDSPVHSSSGGGGTTTATVNGTSGSITPGMSSSTGGTVGACPNGLACRNFHPPAHLLQAWLLRSPSAASLLLGGSFAAGTSGATNSANSSGSSVSSISSKSINSSSASIVSAPLPTVPSMAIPPPPSTTTSAPSNLGSMLPPPQPSATPALALPGSLSNNSVIVNSTLAAQHHQHQAQKAAAAMAAAQFAASPYSPIPAAQPPPPTISLTPGGGATSVCLTPFTPTVGMTNISALRAAAALSAAGLHPSQLAVLQAAGNAGNSAATAAAIMQPQLSLPSVMTPFGAPSLSSAGFAAAFNNLQLYTQYLRGSRVSKISPRTRLNIENASTMVDSM